MSDELCTYTGKTDCPCLLNYCDWCGKEIPKPKSVTTGNFCSNYCADAAEFDRKLL